MIKLLLLSVFHYPKTGPDLIPEWEKQAGYVISEDKVVLLYKSAKMKGSPVWRKQEEQCLPQGFQFVL